MKRNTDKTYIIIGRYLMIAALLLPVTGIALTACGQDTVPAVTAESPAPLPSDEHLRAFEIVKDIHGESFSPIPTEDVPHNAFPAMLSGNSRSRRMAFAM